MMELKAEIRPNLTDLEYIKQIREFWKNQVLLDEKSKNSLIDYARADIDRLCRIILGLK